MQALEIIGFIFGIAGVWLTIKKNIWCFPIGLINVSIIGWLVFKVNLFADVLQQLMYFVLLVYGWTVWFKKSAKEKTIISKCTLPQMGYLFLLFILASAGLGYILKNYTQAAFPYADSIGTIICFLAQGLVAVKKIENWYLWVMANLMYIVIYFLKDMPLYSILSGVYLIMAFIGLMEWRKDFKKQIT